MSSGPGSSGKPCPRLMALLSRASCDIASKMVTGRSPKTLFRECIFGSAADLGGQARRLPADDSPGEMLVIGKPGGLRGERSRHRALSRAAGKHHLLALRVRDRGRIESRERNDHAGRISLGRDLIGLADVDEEITPLFHALGHFLWCQILHLMIGHATSSQSLLHGREAPVNSAAKVASRAGKSSAANSLKAVPNLDRDLRSDLDHPPRRDLEIVGG